MATTIKVNIGYRVIVLCVVIVLTFIFSGCARRNKGTDVETGELKLDVQFVEIDKIQYSSKEEQLTSTYKLSEEDIETFLKALDFDNIIFTDDILKLEPEKLYVTKVNNYQKFYINRDARDNQVYMDFISEGRDGMVWLGAYVEASIVETIDNLASKYAN